MAKIRKAVFRSGIVMMSLLAAIVLSSSVAYAQVCEASIGTAPQVRAEGITEVVGDIELRCIRPSATEQGLFAAVPPMIDISVELNTNITNSIDDDRMVQVKALDLDEGEMLGYSDAEIALEGFELATGTPPTVSTTELANQADLVALFGEGELSDDGATITWEEIASTSLNLDDGENGFSLKIIGLRANASAIGDGGKITAVVSVNGSAVHNTPREAATAKTALVLMDAKGFTKGLQCNKTDETVTIKIREGIEKKRFKTGFMMGDKLVVTFSDIPEGVKVTVPDTAGDPTAPVMDDDTTGDIDETKASVFGLERVTGRISGADEDGVVDLSAAGNGSVKYSIKYPTDEADEVDLEVTFEWAAGVPAMGAAWLNISFDPVSDEGGDTFDVGGAKVPRFEESDNTFGVLAISECGTSLLFPFVTNMHGFDTGVALANASDGDGSCTVSFAGRNDHEMDLAAGATGVFGLSMEATGYQGLMTAQCDFVDAKGFVFISNGFESMGGPTAAQGYLAEDVTPE